MTKTRKFAKTKLGRGLIVFLSFITVFVGLSGFFLFAKKPKPVEAGWWNDTWHYRKSISVGSGSATATNYQILINDYNTSTDITAGKMQSDCGDIRFTSQGGVKLDYWIESGCNTSTTDIWVNVDSIPATGGTTIYMYYGNTSAESVSSGDVVFEFFDVFSTDTTSNYTLYEAGAQDDFTYDGANEQMDFQCRGRDDSKMYIAKNFDLTSGIVVEADWRFSSDPSDEYTNYFGTFITHNLTPMQGSSPSSDQSGVYFYMADDYDVTGDYERLYTYTEDNSQSKTGYAETADYGSSLYTHWFHSQVTYDGSSNFKVEAWEDGTSKVADSSYTVSVDSMNYIGFGDIRTLSAYGSHTSVTLGWVDDIIVRKYLATEPTIGSPGSEEKGDSPIAYWSFDEGYGTTIHNQMEKNGEDGLVSWWKFDDASSGTSPVPQDEMGINDGTWGGSANYTSTSKIGNAGDFSDATDDKVTFSSSILNTAPYTVCTWVKPDSISDSDYHYIIANGGGSSNYYGFCTYLDNTGKWQFGVRNSSGLGGNANIAASDTNWAFICGTWDGTSSSGAIKLYVNGTRAATGTAGGSSSPSSANLKIGGYSLADTYNWDGQIDNVKIFNRALSASEIEAEYNSLHGHMINMAPSSDWVDGARPNSNQKPLGKGLDLDGTDDYLDVSTAKTVQDVQSVSLWINPESTTESIIDLDGGTHYVHISSDTITATGFTSPTIYVNGTVSSTVSANKWSHVVITTGTSFDANDITVGKQSTNYYNGEIDELKLYDFALSSDQVKVQYNRGFGQVMGVGEVSNKGNPPVGFWKMDEGSSYTAFDSSGNENHGELTNMDPDTDWVQGKVGKGLDFDGDNDYVEISDTNYLSFGDASSDNPFTIQAWIYMHDTTNFAIAEKMADSTNGEYLAEANIFILCDANRSNIIYASVADISGYQNQWIHWAGTYDGSGTKEGITIYINGVDATSSRTSSGSYTAMHNTAGDLTIGKRIYVATIYADGKIDHVKIYDYARTVDQIHQDMGGSPIAHWRFDEGYGTTAYDSQNDNDGTLTNMASDDWVDGAQPSSNQKPMGRSLDFESSGSNYIDVGNLSANLQSISFWINPDNTTQSIIDLDAGTHTITVSSGTITAGGFSSPTIYVNRVLGSTISASVWNHVTITTVTAFSASDVDIGRISTNYFNGKLDEVKVYNYALTADEIKVEYNRGSALALGAGLNDSDPGSSNLVGWWKLDEGSGTTTYDISGSGNNGTLTNMDASTDWVQGKFGKGLDFDGSNDQVVASDVYASGSTAGTINTWIYPHAYGSGNTYSTINGFTSDNNSYYTLGIDNNGKIVVFVWDGSVDEGDYTRSSSSVSLNEWSFITYSWDSSGSYIHINGILDGTGDNTHIDAHTDNNMYFGSGYGGLHGMLDGFMDNVKMYNVALSPAEIAWEFNQGAPIAHWRFDEGSGTTAYDESVHNNDGTLTSMDPANDWVSGKRNGALDFDGSNDSIEVTDTTDLEPNIVTVSAWVKRGSTGTTDVILQKGTTASADGRNGYYFVISSDNPAFYIIHDTDDMYSITGTQTINSDTWYHLTGVYDGNNLTVYVNGIQDNTSSSESGDVDYTGGYQNLKLGRSEATGGGIANPFDGQIDEVKIYNYALTEDQVKVEYNSGAVRFE